MPATASTRARRRGLRLLRWGLIALAILVVLIALTVLNNNYSLHHPSRAALSSQLDRAIESSTQWMVSHPEIQGNPPLMLMVGDMADMSGDPRLHSFVESYLASPRIRVPGKPVTWYYAHWVDPTVPLPRIAQSEFPSLMWQDRWFCYATAPDRVDLSASDRADLFSPTKYSWGVRLHLQLIALDIYRHFQGPSKELDAVLGPVTAGVASDAFWDFRVNDSYPQRSAFLLAAGKPDLVRSRWIERTLNYQRSDGSWATCWYGWCRGVFEFKLKDFDPAHTTVQAAWALYQLKYRYSDWIGQHYH